MRLKRCARFLDFADFRKRHDLKAARVSQDRAIPTNKFMKSTKFGHLLCSGPQHQMISVTQNNISARFFHLIKIQPLHRTNRAHGHEGRRANIAASCVHCAAPCQTVFFMKGKSEFLGHAAGHSRLASP